MQMAQEYAKWTATFVCTEIGRLVHQYKMMLSAIDEMRLTCHASLLALHLQQRSAQ